MANWGLQERIDKRLEVAVGKFESIEIKAELSCLNEVAKVGLPCGAKPGSAGEGLARLPEEPGDRGRDELGQRRALEAVLAHFAEPASNPISDVYGGPMVEAVAAWCWDAWPFRCSVFWRRR
jgi:hypothetical protein